VLPARRSTRPTADSPTSTSSVPALRSPASASSPVF
jgi:hypothetical protein